MTREDPVSLALHDAMWAWMEWGSDERADLVVYASPAVAAIAALNERGFTLVPLAAASPADGAGVDVDDPRFRAAVDAVFAAPGEFGPAKGYYGPDAGHFIDMLRAALEGASDGKEQP